MEEEEQSAEVPEVELMDVEPSTGVKQTESTTDLENGAKQENPKEKTKTDLEQMRKKFSKLPLGEDMLGGGNYVSSILALLNAITNLDALVFGDQHKLAPLKEDSKKRWRKVVWLLSVTDHIVEFVPVQHTERDRSNMEITTTKQRKDLLMNIPVVGFMGCASWMYTWYSSFLFPSYLILILKLNKQFQSKRIILCPFFISFTSFFLV